MTTDTLAGLGLAEPLLRAAWAELSTARGARRRQRTAAAERLQKLTDRGR